MHQVVSLQQFKTKIMSTEKKLTAVEWLEQNLTMDAQNYYKEDIKQAKEKEKQQLYDFYDNGFENPNVSAEQHYKETFKN